MLKKSIVNDSLLNIGFSSIFIIFAIKSDLAPALMCGLVVYLLSTLLSERLVKIRVSENNANSISVAVIGLIISAIVIAFISIAVIVIKNEVSHINELMIEMATILDNSHHSMPAWLNSFIPKDIGTAKDLISGWLREHSGDLRGVSLGALHGTVHAIIAMVIGGMLAVCKCDTSSDKPIPAFIGERLLNLSQSFRDIFTAQIKISTVNTVITAIYLLLVLPYGLDVHLPMVWLIIALTFSFGLIPIAGNVVSNAIIVIVSMSVSFQIALLSLSYLVGVHKLEYFINAKIAGSKIHAKSWEMLLAILLMESVFGIHGLLLAPVAYAWIKREAISLRIA